MIEALELDPDSAWLHVQISDLLDRQDMHEDALMASREALKLRPFFRPRRTNSRLSFGTTA